MAASLLSWLSLRGEDDPRTLQGDLHRELASGPLEMIAEQGGSTFSADTKGSSKGKGGTTAGRRQPCRRGQRLTSISTALSCLFYHFLSVLEKVTQGHVTSRASLGGEGRLCYAGKY